MNRRCALMVFFLVLVAASGAHAQDAPSYAKQIRPFVARYCLECHTTKEAKGGLILESYKDILEGSNKGPVLVPGDPAKSRLVKVLDGKTKPVMPPKEAKFHPKVDEIALVVAWIKAGAKDDSKDFKVAIPDIRPRGKPAAPISSVAFQAGGTTLAAGQHHTIWQHNKPSGWLSARPLQERCTAVVFSAKGDFVASAVGNPGSKSHVVFDRELTGTASLPADLPERHADSILDIAISPDGHWLATASYDTQAKLTPLFPKPGDGRAERTLKEHSDAVYAVGFSPDSKLLATCSADRALKVWDVASGKLLYTLGDATDWLYTLAWSPDGAYLASGGVDKSIRVYRVSEDGGKLVQSVFAHEGPVQKIVYSRNGKTLYSLGQDRIVKAWDADRMVESRVFEKLPDTGLAMALGNGEIAVGLYDGTIRILDSKTGKLRSTIPEPDAPPASKDVRRSQSIQPLLTPDAVKIIPASGRRGQALRVIIEGKELDRADEIGVDYPGAAGKVVSTSAAKLEAEISFPPATPAGFVNIHVKNLAGASKNLSFLVDPFPHVKATGGIQAPGTAQVVSLPVSLAGTIDRANSVHYFRFEAAKGQQLGVQLMTKELSSKLDAFLQLTDSHGKILAESTDGLLGHTFATAGAYFVGVRDRELRGGSDFHYRLHLGDLPVVTAITPLGGQRGTEIDVNLRGVFLGKDRVRVTIPADAAFGARVAVPLTTPLGKALGPLELVVGEFADSTTKSIAVPGTADGVLTQQGQKDHWRFTARKGERLILEVHGRRLGSPIDSIIEILDGAGKPVPRVMLRCQAKTFVTFRDHDSVGNNIRIETWGELAINDYLYVGSELMRIKELPTHPDADCIFFSAGGQRTGFLDTTPTHHAMNEPMYKVTMHPPGTAFPPNGYPVFTLYYINDDGGPGFGRDSALYFNPPADGEYQVRVTDARGMGGPNFGYRLTVRPPRPSFNVKFSPTNPVVSKGGAVAISVVAERIDGYDGPIHVQFADLPAGFQAPASSIEKGGHATAFALYADEGAKTPLQKAPLRLVTHADIAGKRHTKEILGETPRVIEPGEIVAFTDESEVTVKPGGQVKLTLHIERRNGFLGRVPLEVRGLPHGVRVLDIGLNGILVNENEVRRTFVVYAEPWVEPTSHPFVILARREGKNTEHAAKSVLIKVMAK